MTFNKAYELAMARSEKFKKHDANVKECIKKNVASACLLFCIGGETFYYGFDGVDLRTGKHTARRSQHLIEHDMALIIL